MWTNVNVQDRIHICTPCAWDTLVNFDVSQASHKFHACDPGCERTVVSTVLSCAVMFVSCKRRRPDVVNPAMLAEPEAEALTALPGNTERARVTEMGCTDPTLVWFTPLIELRLDDSCCLLLAPERAMCMPQNLCSPANKAVHHVAKVSVPAAADMSGASAND